MTAYEFRQRVLSQERAGLSRKSLSFAVEYFVSQHWLTEGHFGACIELAGRYESEPPRMSVDTAVSAASATPISPGAIIASHQWADQLRPWVEQVRQGIFGSPRPPFKTYEEALTALIGTDKNEMVEQAAKEIAGATGISLSAIVAYVLADIRPFVSSAEIRLQDFTCQLPAGGVFKRTQATIEVNWGDLPAGQLKDIRRQVRKDMNIQKVKRLTEEDQRLRNVVTRLGGEPTSGKTAFWEQVRQEWNSAVGTQQYKSWRGPEMRYRRLQQKLQG